MHEFGKLVFVLMAAFSVVGCGKSLSPPAAKNVSSVSDDASTILQKQAASGDVKAQLKLGMSYAKGEGVPKDAAKAAEWLRKAAAQGDAQAQFNFGLMCEKGEGVKKDAIKAIEWYQKAAAQRDADAQYHLGLMYNYGDAGLPKDGAKAVEWLQKAADQGRAKAQRVLGMIYKEGDVVPKDDVKAAAWYQKAAVQGDYHAQFQLGHMYADGTGVPKDAVKAAEWLQKAAAQGDAGAQETLGLQFEYGIGVQKDAVKAVEWYQKAAARGSIHAEFFLAQIYREGRGGVPKDAVKAAEWFQKAAAQGDAGAQAILGTMYDLGRGVPRDSVLSYAWLNLACSQDNQEESVKDRSYLDSIELNSAERSEAERLSSNWKRGQVLHREEVPAGNNNRSAITNGVLVKIGTGTAFVVSLQGHAITNNHVVADCKEVRIQGQNTPVKVITRDEVSDLALLRVPGETRTAAELAPELTSLRQGQDIVVFGFPLDSVLSSGGNLTPGVVSAITGLGNNSNQIQITAPIQPGSSGSPVLDRKGHVVGVVSMKLSELAMAKAAGTLPQNVNFAVNGQTLKLFLDANRVPYKTSGSLVAHFARDMSLADIADEARSWATVVECWK